ncbi:TPA: N-acetylneuraminate lyase [Photobacterium damselae]
MNIQGLYVATLTPFSTNESINFYDLQALVKFNCSSNLNGLYVGGSTAETFLCSIEERIDVLKAVAEAATGDKTLIAHVGDISTRNSEILARSVSNLTYTAISAVTPFYYPVGFEELKKHYQDIIQTSGKPMVIYNIPAFAGMNLSGEQISELLNIEGVIALKQTSTNLYHMEQITRANPGKTVYNGFDEIFASGLIAGAVGGIGSTYNVQAQRIVDIKDAIVTGNNIEAMRLQHEANEVIDVLVAGGVIPSLKYILKEKGVLRNDTCRRPMNKISAGSKVKLKALLERSLC